MSKKGLEFDGFFEVLLVPDEAQGRRDKVVPGMRELGDETVLPVLWLARGWGKQSRGETRSCRNSPALRDWGGSQRVERRGGPLVQQAVHRAESCNSTSVAQGVELAALLVAQNTDSPDLDSV